VTRRRVITRRAVMWLGQTCNLRCHFCYFLDRIDNKEHPEHPFMSLDKAKRICSTLVGHYGNNAIDIQGGEPTIYRHVYELIHHCREIGLLPTLITNAIPLSNARNCDQLKQAGIRDLLISIQGLEGTYDRIVGVDEAFPKQMRGLENVAHAGIPIRFNCVLSKPVLPQLQKIVGLAIEYGARVVNFLTFNPFEDQQLEGKRSALNVSSATSGTSRSAWLLPVIASPCTTSSNSLTTSTNGTTRLGPGRPSNRNGCAQETQVPW
jgi:MoaA/NifB/PqqE/SkfB family radical SAM enzyme